MNTAIPQPGQVPALGYGWKYSVHRIEVWEGADREGRCRFTKFWLADYHPGHPEGESRLAERAQVFHARLLHEELPLLVDARQNYRLPIGVWRGEVFEAVQVLCAVCSRESRACVHHNEALYPEGKHKTRRL
jgi:hypothetical protein